MTDDQEGHSDALRAAAAKRVELKQALSQVEVAASSPHAEVGWHANLSRTLETLQTALLEHVEEVEAQDGLLAELTHQAPRLANQIAHVRDEHPELCRQVDQAIEGAKKESDDVQALRAEVLETLMAIVRHRQKGADLVYEGYSVDIGGS